MTPPSELTKHRSLGQAHQFINLLLESGITLGSPHQPQLEDVIVTSTLDGLVTGVIGDVIVLVLLEEVVGLRGKTSLSN